MAVRWFVRSFIVYYLFSQHPTELDKVLKPNMLELEPELIKLALFIVGVSFLLLVRSIIYNMCTELERSIAIVVVVTFT